MEKGAGKNPKYYEDKLKEMADQKAAKERVKAAEEESSQEKREAKAKALLDSKKQAQRDKDARSLAKRKEKVRCAWLYERILVRVRVRVQRPSAAARPRVA